jgi:hypothetical protein
MGVRASARRQLNETGCGSLMKLEAQLYPSTAAMRQTYELCYEEEKHFCKGQTG